MVEESEELTLRNEIKLYESKKEDWVNEYGEGKFIAIQGDAVLGPYDSQQKAYEEGLNKFGLQPFLVQRVSKEEQVDHLPALELGIIHAGK
ncbi:MAG: hypothetical protein ACOC86_01800 [Candidatus Bipolaricaulota bacterium]